MPPTATSGAISFLTAITKTAGTVNGSTVYAYAFESADPSTYEVMEMTYNSASNKLVRVDTEHGSNGTSAVTFDTTAGAVVIYRVLTEVDLNPQNLATYKRVSASDTSSYSTTGETRVALSDDFSVTPANDSSKLNIRITADIEIERTSSRNDTRITISLQYRNASSVWTDIGIAPRIGYVNQFNGTGIIYASPTLSAGLSAAQVNGSGNWEFRLTGESDYADQTMTCSGVAYEYIETD